MLPTLGCAIAYHNKSLSLRWKKQNEHAHIHDRPGSPRVRACWQRSDHIGVVEDRRAPHLQNPAMHDDKGQPVRRWFVSNLNGPDNETDFAYIGLLDQRSGDIEFRMTAKSRASEDAPSVRGFRYMWTHLYADNMPPNMVIRHEGKCGRCGRTLTVPESIDRGIGPECWGKMAA
jgi:hypothetical protein